MVETRPLAHPQATLARGVVDLWLVALEQPEALLQALAATLSPDEKQRAARFRIERDRRRFVVTRGALRDLLGRQLDCAPASVGLRYGQFGKPALAGAAGGIEFNVAHSGAWAMIALGIDPLGVDLEQAQLHTAMEVVAAYGFSPAERSMLRSCAPARYPIAFFNCWTRKEAIIKALGLELSCSLDSFTVSCLPGEEPCIVAAPPELGRWWLADIAVPAGYSAALASAQPIERYQLHSWTPER